MSLYTFVPNLHFAHDHFKKQEMCAKAVRNRSYLMQEILDYVKTQRFVPKQYQKTISC